MTDSQAERFEPAIPDRVRRAVRAFGARLKARYRDDFDEVRLFGSFARGEQHDESDIDVLVLFTREGVDESAVFDDAAAVDVAEKVWISALPMSRQRYRRMLDEEYGIALAIEEEGIRP